MEQTVKIRKGVTDLSNKMRVRKPKKPFKKNNGARQNFRKGKDGSETGERPGTDRQTEKEESSEKTEKTNKPPRRTLPAKKGAARGKKQ